MTNAEENVMMFWTGPDGTPEGGYVSAQVEKIIRVQSNNGLFGYKIFTTNHNYSPLFLFLRK